MGNEFLKCYQGKKVFITGHSGFKGGWLSVWLKVLGAQVMGYSVDIPTTPSFFNAVGLENHIEHKVGDIRDQVRLVATMQAFAPQFVFHLAAQPLVRASYRAPWETFDTNVMGTLSVLEAVRQVLSVKVCVVVTTDKCYENIETQRGYLETDPLGGHDPYSASKACAEIVTASFRRSFFDFTRMDKHHAVSIATVRAGNVIGGGDWGEDRLLPDCVRALSDQKEIRIRNPQAVRPWQYVLDPLCGYLTLGARMDQYPQQYNEAWNFGPSPEMICVEDIVKKVIGQWGSGRYTILQDEQKEHETRLLMLDASKASARLQWCALYRMDESLRRTMTWYKEFYQESKPEQLWELTVQDIFEYQKVLNRENIAV